ncbi:unnamed protein product [Amoebophrya sp. A25]|nr:unnamed protein product [Amoebophrya sp. A25]|eukprot:GSA25T00014020001.1
MSGTRVRRATTAGSSQNQCTPGCWSLVAQPSSSEGNEDASGALSSGEGDWIFPEQLSLESAANDVQGTNILVSFKTGLHFPAAFTCTIPTLPDGGVVETMEVVASAVALGFGTESSEMRFLRRAQYRRNVSVLGEDAGGAGASTSCKRLVPLSFAHDAKSDALVPRTLVEDSFVADSRLPDQRLEDKDRRLLEAHNLSYEKFLAAQGWTFFKTRRYFGKPEMNMWMNNNKESLTNANHADYGTTRSSTGSSTSSPKSDGRNFFSGSASTSSSSGGGGTQQPTPGLVDIPALKANLAELFGASGRDRLTDMETRTTAYLSDGAARAAAQILGNHLLNEGPEGQGTSSAEAQGATTEGKDSASNQVLAVYSVPCVGSVTISPAIPSASSGTDSATSTSGKGTGVIPVFHAKVTMGQHMGSIDNAKENELAVAKAVVGTLIESPLHGVASPFLHYLWRSSRKVSDSEINTQHFYHYASAGGSPLEVEFAVMDPGSVWPEIRNGAETILQRAEIQDAHESQVQKQRARLMNKEARQEGQVLSSLGFTCVILVWVATVCASIRLSICNRRRMRKAKKNYADVGTSANKTGKQAFGSPSGGGSVNEVQSSKANTTGADDDVTTTAADGEPTQPLLQGGRPLHLEETLEAPAGLVLVLGTASEPAKQQSKTPIVDEDVNEMSWWSRWCRRRSSDEDQHPKKKTRSMRYRKAGTVWQGITEVPTYSSKGEVELSCEVRKFFLNKFPDAVERAAAFVEDADDESSKADVTKPPMVSKMSVKMTKESKEPYGRGLRNGSTSSLEHDDDSYSTICGEQIAGNTLRHRGAAGLRRPAANNSALEQYQGAATLHHQGTGSTLDSSCKMHLSKPRVSSIRSRRAMLSPLPLSVVNEDAILADGDGQGGAAFSMPCSSFSLDHTVVDAPGALGVPVPGLNMSSQEQSVQPMNLTPGHQEDAQDEQIPLLHVSSSRSRSHIGDASPGRDTDAGDLFGGEFSSRQRLTHGLPTKEASSDAIESSSSSLPIRSRGSAQQLAGGLVPEVRGALDYPQIKHHGQHDFNLGLPLAKQNGIGVTSTMSTGGNNQDYEQTAPAGPTRTHFFTDSSTQHQQQHDHHDDQRLTITKDQIVTQHSDEVTLTTQAHSTAATTTFSSTRISSVQRNSTVNIRLMAGDLAHSNEEATTYTIGTSLGYEVEIRIVEEVHREYREVVGLGQSSSQQATQGPPTSILQLTTTPGSQLNTRSSGGPPGFDYRGTVASSMSMASHGHPEPSKTGFMNVRDHQEQHGDQGQGAPPISAPGRPGCSIWVPPSRVDGSYNGAFSPAGVYRNVALNNAFSPYNAALNRDHSDQSTRGGVPLLGTLAMPDLEEFPALERGSTTSSLEIDPQGRTPRNKCGLSLQRLHQNQDNFFRKTDPPADHDTDSIIFNTNDAPSPTRLSRNAESTRTGGKLPAQLDLNLLYENHQGGAEQTYNPSSPSSSSPTNTSMVDGGDYSGEAPPAFVYPEKQVTTSSAPSASAPEKNSVVVPDVATVSADETAVTRGQTTNSAGNESIVNGNCDGVDDEDGDWLFTVGGEDTSSRAQKEHDAPKGRATAVLPLGTVGGRPGSSSSLGTKLSIDSGEALLPWSSFEHPTRGFSGCSLIRCSGITPPRQYSTSSVDTHNMISRDVSMNMLSLSPRDSEPHIFPRGHPAPLPGAHDRHELQRYSTGTASSIASVACAVPASAVENQHHGGVSTLALTAPSVAPMKHKLPLSASAPPAMGPAALGADAHPNSSPRMAPGSFFPPIEEEDVELLSNAASTSPSRNLIETDSIKKTQSTSEGTEQQQFHLSGGLPPFAKAPTLAPSNSDMTDEPQLGESQFQYSTRTTDFLSSSGQHDLGVGAEASIPFLRGPDVHIVDQHDRAACFVFHPPGQEQNNTSIMGLGAPSVSSGNSTNTVLVPTHVTRTFRNLQSWLTLGSSSRAGRGRSATNSKEQVRGASSFTFPYLQAGQAAENCMSQSSGLMPGARHQVEPQLDRQHQNQLPEGASAALHQSRHEDNISSTLLYPSQVIVTSPPQPLRHVEEPTRITSEKSSQGSYPSDSSTLQQLSDTHENTGTSEHQRNVRQLPLGSCASENMAHSACDQQALIPSLSLKTGAINSSSDNITEKLQHSYPPHESQNRSSSSFYADQQHGGPPPHDDTETSLALDSTGQSPGLFDFDPAPENQDDGEGVDDAVEVSNRDEVVLPDNVQRILYAVHEQILQGAVPKEMMAAAIQLMQIQTADEFDDADEARATCNYNYNRTAARSHSTCEPESARSRSLSSNCTSINKATPQHNMMLTGTTSPGEWAPGATGRGVSCNSTLDRGTTCASTAAGTTSHQLHLSSSQATASGTHSHHPAQACSTSTTETVLGRTSSNISSTEPFQHSQSYPMKFSASGQGVGGMQQQEQRGQHNNYILQQELDENSTALAVRQAPPSTFVLWRTLQNWNEATSKIRHAADAKRPEPGAWLVGNNRSRNAVGMKLAAACKRRARLLKEPRTREVPKSWERR